MCYCALNCNDRYLYTPDSEHNSLIFSTKFFCFSFFFVSFVCFVNSFVGISCNFVICPSLSHRRRIIWRNISVHAGNSVSESWAQVKGKTRYNNGHMSNAAGRNHVPRAECK